MATPPAISFVEGRPDRDIHRDLLNLRTYAHGIDNYIWMDPGAGFSAGTQGQTQNWPRASHPDGSATGTRWSFYLPPVWVGANAHIVWYVSEASADAGNFRLTTTVRVSADINGVDLSGLADALSESVTDAAGAANTPKAITTSTFAITGRHIVNVFVRSGADADDTATVALILWGGLLVRE